MNNTLARVMAITGGAIVLAACFIPYVRYESGSSYALVDHKILRETWAYLLEPLAVVIGTVLIVTLLLGRLRQLSASLLVAIGVWSALLFLELVLAVASSRFASLLAGGFIGFLGAALILGAGLATLLSDAAEPASRAAAQAAPSSSPPAGWYPDPVTPDVERLWDGDRWTQQVRGRQG